MSDEALAAAIDQVARTLSRPAVEALASALARTPHPDADARRAVLAVMPVGVFTVEATRLLDAWVEHAYPGSAVALALRSAACAVESGRGEQAVDVVWTGPTTRVVPVRLTRAVLLEVIDAAERELLLVSYVAFRVQEVLDRLAEAARRGVTIKLVLETTEDSAGRLTLDAAQAFASVREHVGFYIWPSDQRPRIERGHAVLHAKTAIADDYSALITSANLTEHAIRANMELGILIRGGPHPRRLRDHIKRAHPEPDHRACARLTGARDSAAVIAASGARGWRSLATGLRGNDQALARP